MSVGLGTDGLIHPPDGGLHDHHAAPTMVSISSLGVVSIPPGSTHDLDITLPRSDYQRAHVQVHGPKAAVYITPSSSGYEGHSLEVGMVTTDAVGHGARSVSANRQYNGSFSKLQGAAVLTDYVYDSNTGSSARYIAIQDCWIIGAVLRLRMHNQFGGSAFIWIRGKADLL